MAKTRFDVARVSVWVVHQGTVMEDVITSLIGYYEVVKNRPLRSSLQHRPLVSQNGPQFL